MTPEASPQVSTVVLGCSGLSGSCEVFRVFSLTQAKMEQMSTPTAPANPAEPWRVLVVDDEPDLVEVLCGAMLYEGWETIGAATGGEAVRAAAQHRPDAVVLDMMLPDMDGLEVLRRIHASQPEIRVLFLTARDAVEDRIEGITAGGDDYVTKPFSLDEVIARLRGLLRRAEQSEP